VYIYAKQTNCCKKKEKLSKRDFSRFNENEDASLLFDL
jgi:hypothetical protein